MLSWYLHYDQELLPCLDQLLAAVLILLDPRVPGHEIAGVIDSLGKDLKDWKSGQLVDV
jgi:threonine dehydrogenase-like Zn-dependent dehydrogenase